jgi:autotransporter-associated beta strand protein
MKRSAVLAASVAAIAAGLVSVAGAQEIETFDSPNQTQVGNGNFQFATPIQGACSSSNGGTITDNPTNVTISTNPPAGSTGAYGTAYHNIYTQDNPNVIDISHSYVLQLDTTISQGQAGLIVDLLDGEQTDFWQYYLGYGLVGSGNAAPQYPGETIKELGNNELLIDIPLSMPLLKNGAPTFDFTQLVLFRLEDDPGSSLQNTIAFNDLSAIPLTWNNGSGNHLWDTTSVNWSIPTGNLAYPAGAPATFNDSNGGAANYAVTLNTTVSPTSVDFKNSLGNYVISGTGSIGGATTVLTKSGTGNVTLGNTGTNTYGGGTTVSAGELIIGAAGALPVASNVTITGGTLQLGTGTGPETLSSLAISGSGSFDINNNHIFLTDGTGVPATIIAYLQQGFSTNWAGPGGIISSAAASHPGYGVAFGEGGVISRISSGQIELSYTLYGDVNQDGGVNGTDFGILANNFGKNVTGGWEQGDFTYAGKVNATDFGLLAANFGKSATGQSIALPAADWAALDSFAAAHGLTAALPEPGTIGLMALAGVGTLARRRRQA